MQVKGSSQEMCNHIVALDPASMNVTREGWISHWGHSFPLTGKISTKLVMKRR